MATQTRGSAAGEGGQVGAARRRRTGPPRRCSCGRLSPNCARSIWPTRKELVTYTTVALVFILIMVAIVTSLDYGFTKLVLRRLRLRF